MENEFILLIQSKIYYSYFFASFFFCKDITRFRYVQDDGLDFRIFNERSDLLQIYDIVIQS